MTKELKRILYVEDELDIQSITKIALEDLGGFTLNCCQSGKDALQVVETFQPDLLLLDVMMPDMDGPATLNELRKLAVTQKTPVIFMTARVQESEINVYKQLGVIGVLPKPFEPMKLASEILKIWNNHYEQ